MPDTAYRIGVDTGGTFTDLVVVAEDGSERRTVKVPSVPAQPALAPLDALRRSGAAESATFFVLGTTVATNALLERKAERTIYVTTEGFQDVPFIQRINRLGLYDLQWVKPAPYVARADCLGVKERIAYDGSVRVPLEEAEIERVVNELAGSDGAIAVNLLFSYANPEHEQRLAAAVRGAFPGRSVSTSSEVAPRWREYERANTVIVDASLKQLIAAFADDLDRGLQEAGLRCPRFFLKSNGGQIRTAAAARRPVDLILSGLAGGLIAGKHYADAIGLDSVVTLDMGGTSADVGLVLGRRIRSTTQYEFEFGLPVVVPVVDLTTIGAGGSSVATLDAGGFLKVGPESAGADPGPACYGRGGSAATVTDANVVLGRLNPEYFLGGELPLDAERAHAVVGDLGSALGLTVEETAQAIIELAVESMTNAIRVLCADRGLDYRLLDLMAFGGAGPLHGALIARRLGLRRAVIPPEPGLASAFGALAADLRVDRRLTRSFSSDANTGGELRTALRSLADQALSELREDGEALDPVVTVSAACRYAGQNYEQEIPLPLDAKAEGGLLALTVERFHSQHEATYGYRLPDATVEVVELAAVAIDATRALALAARAPEQPADEPERRQRVYFKDDGWVESTVVRRTALAVGASVAGPAVIEEPDSTVLVLAGQHAWVHATGALVVESAPLLPNGLGEPSEAVIG